MSIWKYVESFPHTIQKENQLTIGEGNTRSQNCEAGAAILETEKLYLKREDQNPTGSAKDRSLVYQISNYAGRDKTSFVISSSGNAAISAIAICKKYGYKLDVFISNAISSFKLQRILEETDLQLENIGSEEADFERENITLHFSKKPKSNAVKFCNEHSEYINLRGSTDEYAPVGFQTISYELIEQCPDADALFVPCSSGTTTKGLFDGYTNKQVSPPALHIIQTTKIHPIAKVFDTDCDRTDTSIATAISDRVANRKREAIQAIKKTNGYGWVVTDTQIQRAQTFLKQNCNAEVSYDSALTLAGLQKALDNGFSYKRPILLITG